MIGVKEKITVELEPTEVFKIVQALGEQPAHSSAQLYLKMRELWSNHKNHSIELYPKKATVDNVRNIVSEI
ncbi:MAG: hypothetical protein PHC68_15045 [Syntrophorhabdaceae bacterium]|nr:hypothetical protein [Syntrophorhabdaceae bacterium]